MQRQNIIFIYLFNHMSDDKNVTFMNNNKSLVNIAYSSTCIILFTKRFYLRLKAAFVSFLLI